MSKTIEQISVFVENSKGRMAEITRVIADAKIEIRALSVADTSDFGILRLIVDNPNSAVEALQKAGITVSITKVIAVGIKDMAGAFADVITIISDSDINIEYMYAFISRCSDQAQVIMRVDDNERGIAALEAKGISILSKEDVANA